MAIINTDKRISKSIIPCDGTFDVTLSVTAEPDILKNPTDIVLILDRSSSMGLSNKLVEMQKGAKEQIDIITTATGGVIDNRLGGGSKMGLVYFGTDATIAAPLSPNVNTLKGLIDVLTAGGATNHGDAFLKAESLFNPASKNRKIIVMFTDGENNQGPPPTPIATDLKSKGIEIYCIGIGVTIDTINAWASDPVLSHVAWTKEVDKLAKLFVDVGKEIVSPGSTTGQITEVLNTDFSIQKITAPLHGTAQATSSQELIWNIGDLGVTSQETAQLTFTVKHNNDIEGTKKVNESIRYQDSSGIKVTFPDPTIKVACNKIPTIVENCPTPVDFIIDKCHDSAVINLNNVELSSLGRIVQFDTTIKNICPGKQVAVAVQLTEVDSSGNEYPRGMKYFTIPKHTADTCSDVEIKCIRFVLPEDQSVAECCANSLCGTRNFKARVMANYIDTDFLCCDTKIIMP